MLVGGLYSFHLAVFVGEECEGRIAINYGLGTDNGWKNREIWVQVLQRG